MNTNVTMIPVAQLHPHPDNPRKDLGDITELTASIKANGVLQNLTVVPRANPDVNYEKLCRQYYGDPTEENRTKLNQFRNTDGYTVIIGHRRLAAAKAAGLMELPCIVVEDMTLEEQISTMMTENMQRSDLTVYEEAEGFQMMMDFGNSVEQVADKAGFSESTIRRRVKLLSLDREGLYPSMVEAAHRWRRNFLSVGAKFLWFCLPFKQVSVIDHLSSSESWITWEPGKEDVWMRKPPDFAIMYSPYLHYPGEMNYQTFCGKAFADGIQLVGLRTAESLTRLKCIANAKMERIVRGGKFYPIYDWRDSDVWLYIKQRNLEFPEIYMRLYEAGVRKNALRLCAFFGDCSTQGLRWVAETDADLWDRIQKREPNAYLVLLYWDSEMFRRSTKKRRDLEAGTEKKDYKALCKDILFLHPEKYTIAKDTKAHLDMWRGMFIKTYGIAMDKHYKTMYEGLLYGDPKMRVLRILWTEIYNDHNMMIKEAQRGKQQH